MVFYRKYRPQTIDQLDLSAVREKFTAILSHENLPHAFLFTGPKGLGKTSSARILAKAINCEGKNQESRVKNQGEKTKKKADLDSRLRGNDKEIEPCNICDACISITNGSNIDVLEIDAASNRGIDEIRELRERVKFSSSSLRYKVYIIDEVHMLTTEAFNALLKTLEEPPSHVVFILCTTEVWKLPSTIISRAFHVQFEKPTCEEVVRSLNRVVAGEGLEVEEGVLEKIFTLCDGAFRDGTKILEELVLSIPDRKITLEVLEKAYKTDSMDGEVRELLVYLSQKNTKEVLKIVENFAAIGCDFKIVIEKMVNLLRMELLEQSGLNSDSNSHPNPLSQREGIMHLDVSQIEKLLELCNEAHKNLKFAVLPQLPLELLTIKWCMGGEENHSSSKSSSREVTPEKVTVIPAKAGIQEGLTNDGNIATNVRVNPTKVLDSRFHGNDKGNSSDQNFLRDLIEQVKKDNFSIAGVLRSCSLIAMTDDKVELMAPFKFHGDKLRDSKIMNLLETRAKVLLEREVRFIISVKGE